MSKFLRERMASFTWGSRYKVRVWIKVHMRYELRHLGVSDRIALHIQNNLDPSSATAAAEWIAKEFAKDIAAVEVTGADGNGWVVYTEWP